MQLQVLCIHLTALLLFIASSVQAGPVGLAHRDVLESGGHIKKRDGGIHLPEQGSEETGEDDNKGARKRENSVIESRFINPIWSGNLPADGD